jgi:hypothetical protein
MEENDYTVQVEDVQDLLSVKNRYQVPPELRSCHTAIVDGYVIEGHVPVADIERMLDERPDIIGLAVPGMPAGSPGMGIPGAGTSPYDVVAFDQAGNFEVYASYGN